MKLNNMSLRYKFLFVLGILLAASIFSYLLIAVNLFNDDKKAYVYDSNASLVNSLASESAIALENAVDTIETLARMIKTRSSRSEISFANQLFKLNKNIVYVEIHDATKYFATKDHKPIYQKAKRSYLESLNLKIGYYGEILKNGLVKKSTMRNRRYTLFQDPDSKAPLLTLAVVTSSGAKRGDDLVAIAHLRKDRLTSIFSRSDLYHTSLINDNAEVLIDNRNDKSWALDEALIKEKVIQQNIRSSVITYTSGNHKDYILAFAKLDRLGLTVLSEIESDLAYLASRRLIEKSIQFALLILLIALIVSIVFTKRITQALSVLYRGTLKIGEGDFTSKINVASGDEIGHLANSFNIMSDKIGSLLEQEKEKVGLEKELATAQTVQNTFFPTDTKTCGPLTISGRYLPATQCGGDWWGHVEGAGGIQYVFIADAMGHGVSAALVTAMAYSSCQTLAELIRSGDMENDSPADILEKFNNVLYDAVKGKVSMTFFALKIDTLTGQLTYANAGHNFPILFPRDKNDKRAGRVIKSFRKISERPPINLSLSGTPLGVTRDCKFKEETIDMMGGDKLVLFTDGIIECRNPKGDTWGRKTLVKNILGIVEQDASSLQDSIFSLAQEFFDGEPLDDDLTTVVIEVDENYNTQPAKAVS